MANFKKNEEGVSAVIGVILMVAITVILAAVIAAFVFQLGGNVPKTKNVALEVARTNPTTVYVKNMGGTDANQLIPSGTTPVAGSFNVTVNGVPATHSGTTFANNQVGSIEYFTGVTANSQVTVVGNFNDGSTAVLWTGTIQ